METSTMEQHAAMMSKPQKEHQWLQKFVGEWRFEGQMMMGPDQPAESYRGTESVRSIGGIWIVGEGRSPMPDGSTVTTMTTVGYDPQKGRFVGSFFMSLQPYLWIYDGELDPNGRVLTLNTEGPDMSGRMTKSQDMTEFVNDDHRVVTSRMQGEDGQWYEVLRMDHWRLK